MVRVLASVGWFDSAEGGVAEGGGYVWILDQFFGVAFGSMICIEFGVGVNVILCSHCWFPMLSWSTPLLMVQVPCWF